MKPKTSRSLLPVLPLLASSSVMISSVVAQTTPTALRPPSVPLVAHDPYFSVWSGADRLTDQATHHWTGKSQPLTSLIRIDGKSLRLMGDGPKSAEALPQTGVQVLPTRTLYDFEGEGIHVTLTFMTPALPEDLDVLSRPVTYVTWDVRAVDGKKHKVSLYDDASAALTVNTPDQTVSWSRQNVGTMTALRIGSSQQAILQKRGDDLRIDWGYLFVASPQKASRQALASQEACWEAFIRNGGLPDADDTQMPKSVRQQNTVAAVTFDLGDVGSSAVSRHLLLAYDDEYSITFFRQNLRPYWRRNGLDAAGLLKKAESDYASLQRRCKAFDTELMADLTKVGGEKYARLCALAYRQGLAAQKVVADKNGQPLVFSKENFSNGCIATVDIIYPTAPQLLLFSPTLAKASLVPVLKYASSERWKFPFAPHDLGTYPIANGQVYGGGERTEDNQMPVEESGNMLILLAAIAQHDGNADFAAPYWPLITRWAEYLQAKGFDPENQLCTDDFAGHLAHNVNLSVKAIEALGAYSRLCELRGDTFSANKYRKLTQEMANRWVKEATDGDHTRLAFDRPGTWSQKYNLVWDKILAFNYFPAEVAKKETAFYKTQINTYGLPLDNRETYTKLDWCVWTATLAESRADFDAQVGPVYDFLSATPNRVPMNDWYQTKTARQQGFQARSVVGGVFIKMLSEPAVWKKWASRDKNTAKNWASIPPPPVIQVVVPTSQETPSTWSYTNEKPSQDWFSSGFDASSWKQGPAGFGTSGTPGAVVRTNWNTSDIWMRREFVMPEGRFDNLQILGHHDEDAEVYINGVLAATYSGFTGSYDLLPLSPAGRAALRPGKNIIAVHCHQTTGGQYIDLGFAQVIEPKH
jgi:hypothetical protein